MDKMPKQRQALVTEAGNAMQAYQRSTQAFDDAVGRALGVNPTDLRALDWLYDGPKSAGQLSGGTGLSAAATTDLIDRLVQKGFVQRIADPTDRRRVLVGMTEEGAARVGRYYLPLVADGTELLADVSDEQLAWMRAWLASARELTDRHRQRLEETSDPPL
jgi:DNA-binding MarR family transcriptional regulator